MGGETLELTGRQIGQKDGANGRMYKVDEVEKAAPKLNLLDLYSSVLILNNPDSEVDEIERICSSYSNLIAYFRRVKYKKEDLLMAMPKIKREFGTYRRFAKFALNVALIMMMMKKSKSEE